MGIVRNLAEGIGGVVRGGLRVLKGVVTLRPREIWGGIKEGLGGVLQFAKGALPVAGLALGGVGLLGLAGLGPLAGGLAGGLGGLGGIGSSLAGMGSSLAGSFSGMFAGAGSFLSGGMSMFSGLGSTLGFGAQAAGVGTACASAGGLSGLQTFMMAAPMVSMGMNMMGGMLTM